MALTSVELDRLRYRIRERVRGNPNPTKARPGFRQTFDPLSGYIPETYFVIAPSTTGRDCGPSAA